MAPLQHGIRPMTGRDRHATHRAATPLELLFDLTFVIAFGTAANEFAHFLVEDHVGAGLIGFAFATFAVSWAWINFTWFASAYDTDDWAYRLMTMLQMVGVLIFALGIPAMYESIEHGEHFEMRVMVLGYVLMRVAMVGQWWRARRSDPERRSACTAYIVSILTAQAVWCLLAVQDLSLPITFLFVPVAIAIELAGPYLAETRFADTPWHPHHIAERYGLLVIISLGEGMIGTMASLTALAGGGLTLDVVLLAAAGTAMTFGMWWTYFVLPHADVLHGRRSSSFEWGYGHIPIFGAIVAVGAGLHAGAFYIDHHTALSATGTVLTVAIPLALYILGLELLYARMSRTFPILLIAVALVSVAVLAVPVLMAAAGVGLTWCLLVLALAPWVKVVGYEAAGHRHHAALLERLGA